METRSSRQGEEQLRAVFEGMAVGAVILNTEGRIVSCNSALQDMLGYSEDELRGASIAALVHPEDAAEIPEDGRDRERRYSTKGGAALWGRLTVLQGCGKPGEPVVGMIEDVTERREAEEELEKSEERFRQLFEQSVDALFLHDEKGRVVDCNAEACRSLGYTREELLNLSVKDFVGDLLTKEEKRTLGENTPWRKAMSSRTGEVVNFHQNRHRRKDGTTFPVEVGISSIDYEGRRLIFASARDVTRRKALEDELLHRTLHDPLTGMPNRTLFIDRLGHALQASSRREDTVAVLFLDLDNFKFVNDSLGHGTGDELLICAGRRLEACLRPGDTVARLGGDEFAVLLEDVAGWEEVVRVVERLMEGLEKPLRVGEQELFVAASIGAVVAASPQTDPEALLRSADLAMYQAKGSGKARYAFYEESMHARASERLKLERDLRRAVERKEFVVYYQPKVLLETGVIFGVEALVRWEHPERGLVSPAEFIPLTEETGLIVPLGTWILEEACRQAKEWQYAPELLLSVNVSARQFRQPDLVENVARVLSQTGFEPEKLVLEITESDVMDNAEMAVAKLEDLKALGVWLSIDDFGTGYSSLSYLKRFPVDFLKIDRSFVNGLGEILEDTVLVSGILGLARSMGLEVVAEGVETADQLEKLREMGCTFGQGYYFSKPVPTTDLTPLLAHT